MKRKILLIVSIVIAIIITITFFVLRNNIVSIAKNNINGSIKSIYSFINKYEYDNYAKVNVIANYKGAHGSTNPVNFDYNSYVEYNNDELSIYFTNNDGYNVLKLNNDLINIYMRIRNMSMDEFISIFQIKSIDYNIGKIILNIDNNSINSLFNTDIKNLKMVVNTDLLNVGIKDYELLIDDETIKISNNFEEITGNDLRLSKSNDSYHFNYKNFKMNYSFNESDRFIITFDNYVVYLELLNNRIILKVNKEISIYKGLEFDIKFEDVKINMTKELDKNSNPILRYFDIRE